MAEFYDAFISYGRADSKEFATKLHQRLTEKGLKVWFDQNDIPLGVDFQNQINDGIEKSHNFLFIIAPHSVKSIYCRKEVDLAVKCNKRIIPLLHVMPQTQEVWDKMHPDIGKINWIYFQEDKDDFEKSFNGLINVIQSHKNYVEQHTQYLTQALSWERDQKRTQLLLVGKDRQLAEEWLKTQFKDEQPPCIPSNLHCEYICESTKNANNLMTHIFLSYAEENWETMQKIRYSLMREGFTVWTNKTDIKAGIDFEESLKQGIEGADRIVYLLSADSLKSEYCQQEINYARSFNKPIITVRLDQVAPEQLPDSYKKVQFIDFAQTEDEQKYAASLDKLIGELQEDAYYYEQHKTLLVKALKWERQSQNIGILLRGHYLQNCEGWLKLAKSRTDYPPLPIQEKFIAESLAQPQDSSVEVFVSYSRADADFARQLNDALQQQGKTTWFDQESIASGTDFQQEIHRGIENSDNFLFIISPNAIASPYCADELEHAQKLNKRFVPVLYQPIEPQMIPAALANIQWIDFSRHGRDFFANFSDLLRTLDTDREHVRSHTKWSQRALEWESKEKSSDLLLRGSEFAIAQNWLEDAEQQQKQPPATALQQDYIQQSQAAITAAILREKRNKQILRALLGLATGGFVVSTVLGIAAFRLYQEASVREIDTFIESSQSLYASGDKLNSLIVALRAKKSIRNLKLVSVDEQTRNQANQALSQAVYGVIERNRLWGHGGGIYGVAVSPNGSLFASGSSDRTIKLWRKDGTEIETLRGHQGGICSVSFSPDGTQLVSGGADNQAFLWTVPKSGETSSKRIALSGHKSSVYAVTFSPDGKIIATASGDKTVRLWKRDGAEITTLKGHKGGVYAVAFSPDGKTIATGSQDKTVILWRQKAGVWKPVQIIQDKNSSSEIATVKFSPDGKLLATGDSDRAVKLWDVSDGTLKHTLTGHTGAITSLDFSPSKEHDTSETAILASVAQDGTINVWKSSDGTLLTTITGHNDSIEEIAFTRDGKAMVTASLDQSVRLWQLDSENRDIFAAYRDHRREVNAATYSAQKQFIATAGKGTRIQLWWAKSRSQAKNLAILQDSKKPSGAIWDLSVSPDGNVLASASEDRLIRLWDTTDPNNSNTSQPLKRVPGHDDIVYTVAFSPDGTWFASGSEDNTVRLWKRDGTPIQTLKDPSLQSQSKSNGKNAPPTSHAAPVWKVAIAPDSQTLASASDDGTIKLWSKDGRLLQTIPGYYPSKDLNGHKATITGLAFSQNGQYLVSAAADNSVKLWEFDGVQDQNGQTRKTLRYSGKSFSRPGLSPFRVAFSPDSNVVAITSVSGMVELWNVQNGRVVSLKGHRQRTQAVAFVDPDKLVSTGVDAIAILWNLQNSLENSSQDNLSLVKDGCNWVRDYLSNRTTSVTTGNREDESKKQVHQLCQSIPQKTP